MRILGLDTLKRAAFLRPVQIMRQTISNLETGNSRYAHITDMKVCQEAAKSQGIEKDIHYPW
jgi:hypothetical protein